MKELMPVKEGLARLKNEIRRCRLSEKRHWDDYKALPKSDEEGRAKAKQFALEYRLKADTLRKAYSLVTGFPRM